MWNNHLVFCEKQNIHLIGFDNVTEKQRMDVLQLA